MTKVSLASKFKYKLKAYKIRRAARLELHDLLFHFDSSVMMPGAIDASTPEASGLRVMAAGFKYAEDNPDKVALVAGHTDTSGPDDYNIKLSGQRGKNAYFLLKGDRDGWVGVCDKKHQVIDWQHVTKWLTREQGWDCDPGALDNKDGPKTKAAVKKFQQQYNVKFAQSISEDGVVGKQTWGAFYDVYESIMADLLDTDTSGLGDYRGKIKYLEGGKEFVGCGESWPIEGAGVQGLRSQTNRRVEILFFDKDDPVTLDCHPGADQCKPDKCMIYKSGTVIITPIPVTPQPIKVQSLQIILWTWDAANKKDAPVKDRPWTSSKPVATHGKTKSDGKVEIPVSSTDAEAALAVDMRDPRPEAADDPAPATQPTDYPPKIIPGDFKDRGAEPALPPREDDLVKWQLSIINPEAAETDDALKSRLHNLGFDCDAKSDDEATKRAVKAYQALYLDQADGSGKLSDIKDDLKKRHDNP